MTPENHFTNFYDSDFDSLNEADVDDCDLLNVAFIDSPENSSVFSNTSLSDLDISECLKMNNKNWISTAKRRLKSRFGDLAKEIGSIKNSETYEVSEISHENEKSRCIFTSTCLDEFPKSPKECDLKKIDTQSNQVEKSEKTKQPINLSKENGQWPKCIFTPTYQVEFHKSSNEYYNKFDKLCNPGDAPVKHPVCSSKENEEKNNYFFKSTCTEEYQFSAKEHDWLDKCCNREDETEKTESQIKCPVSSLDFIPHELSTILEVDSLLTDESFESSTSSDKYSNNLFKKDSKDIKFSTTLNKSKGSSYFPSNVLKVIQDQHIEKFLQEPGILEEEELTLVSLDYGSIFNFTMETSNQGYSHSYKIKRSNSEESPSMISFLRHEIECMKDCQDE